jgi:hypothetical protein
VADEAKRIGDGFERMTRGIGKSLAEGAKNVGPRAQAAGQESKPTGEALEQRAKGFGESIWDGMKAVGRSIRRFFTIG